MNETSTPKLETRAAKKPHAKTDGPATYVNLSAELAKLEAKLHRQRGDVTATEEALKAMKNALTAELARVK
jgi:hypothetical protein